MAPMFYTWFFRSMGSGHVKYGLPFSEDKMTMHHIASGYKIQRVRGEKVPEKAILDEHTFRTVVSTRYSCVDIVNCHFHNGVRMPNHKLCLVDVDVVGSTIFVHRDYSRLRNSERCVYDLHKVQWFCEESFLHLIRPGTSFIDSDVLFHVFNNDELRTALNLPDYVAKHENFKQEVYWYNQYQKRKLEDRRAKEEADETEANRISIEALLSTSFTADVSDDATVMDADKY